MIVVTNTGGRPEALALCAHRMRRQDYAGQVVWIIASDVESPPEFVMPNNWYVVPIRAHWTWKPGRNTQASLLAFALTRARIMTTSPMEPILIVEDDDYYAPGWLSAVHENMKDGSVDVFGETNAIYYHVGARLIRDNQNTRHASLCNTAVAGPGFNCLLDLCEKHGNRNTFLDMKLWALGLRNKLVNTRHVVGMKGLPGRGGIGAGHLATSRRWTPDPDLAKLRELIGDEDAEHYEKFYEPAIAS